MANPTSSEEFGFCSVQYYSASSNRSSESVDGGYGGQKVYKGVTDAWIEFAGSDSDYGFYDQSISSEQGLPFSKYQLQEQKEQSYLGYGLLDDPSVDMLSPPFRTCMEEISKLEEKKNSTQDDIEPKKETRKLYPFPFASLELLKKHGCDLKRAINEKVIQPSHKTPCTKAQEMSQMYSTEEIIRIAGARFIQFSTQIIDVETMLNNPYDLSFSGLSSEEVKKVELVEFLLASAEKVGNEQFEKASRLLKHCDENSSNSGNAVERLVFYFCNAIQERIDQETGRASPKGKQKEQRTTIYEAMMAPSYSNIVFHQEIPFSQVSHFAGVQAIIENVANAKRIHIIDLEIRNGQQWTILMQALESRRECIELLRITAMGTTSKQLIENTGKRLMNFARTMNLTLSFNVVMVSDFLDLTEDQFEVDAEETVAVYCEYLLPSLIAQPERLDSLIKVIKNINPCIMVVSEVEANHNSPVFVNRFIEALFYTSAYFDCLDTCMEQDDPNRMIIEAMFFGEAVRRILAKEGEERLFRNVKLSVWRDYFVRFGLEETELSMSSKYQAELVLKNFSCGRFCTLKMDEKSLIIGWKGTPIQFLSAWKFTYQ